MTGGVSELAKALRAGVGPAWLAVGAAVIAVLTFVLMIDQALAVWASTRVEAPSAAAAGSTDVAPLRAVAIKKQTALIDGRSLFVVPPKPEPRRAEAIEPERAAPLIYGGPSPVAMINNTVWFNDGRRVIVGGQAQGDDDLRVISSTPPWSAKVMWQGGEFSLDLFARNSLVIPKARERRPPLSPAPSGLATPTIADPDSVPPATADPRTEQP